MTTPTPTPTPTPVPGSPTWMRPLGSTGLQVSAVCAGGVRPRQYAEVVRPRRECGRGRRHRAWSAAESDSLHRHVQWVQRRREVSGASARRSRRQEPFRVDSSLRPRSTHAAATTRETGSGRRSPRVGRSGFWPGLPAVGAPSRSRELRLRLRSPRRAAPLIHSSRLKESGKCRLDGTSPAAGSGDGAVPGARRGPTCCWSTTVGRFWTAAREALIAEAPRPRHGNPQCRGVRRRHPGQFGAAGPTTHGHRPAPPEILEAIDDAPRMRRERH